MIISNLGQFLTGENSSPRPASGKWTAVDYQTAQFEGSFVFTSNGPPQTGAIRIPLGFSGRYTIYVGTYYGHSPSNFWAMSPQFGGKGTPFVTRLKLDGDEAFDTIGDEYYGPKSGPQGAKSVDSMKEILEVRWKTVDLKGGEKLIITDLSHEAFAWTMSGLAYLRLVPEDDRPDGQDRRLVAMLDSSFFGGSPKNPQEVRDMLEPFRDSDFRSVCWEIVKGDNTYYPTAVGRMLPELGNTLMAPNYLPRDLRRLVAEGDPIDIYTQTAHELGLEFYASLRLMGTRFPYAFYTWPSDGGFFFENRQFWTVDEKGQSMPHLSLAFPEVRQYILSFFREQLERYDIDGVNMLYNRSYPFVLFEQPVRSSFMERYGDDPATLDRMDERFWRHKAEYITIFMRDLRKLVNQSGQRGVSAIVMNSPRQSLYFGLDVETWIREGLVDQLIVHPCFSAEAFDGTWVTPENIAEYIRIADSSGVRICPDFYPRHLSPEKIITKALDYYEAGATGISFWDVYSRFWRKSEWSVIKHAGNIDRMRRWQKHQPVFWRKTQIDSFAGISLDDRYGSQTHG